MQTTFCAVQLGCRSARQMVNYRASTARNNKRWANRRYRRYLNVATRSFISDPDKFDDETFEAPIMTAWDIV